MSESTWNPWKLTAIGMALVMVTALVTGLVVANWSGNDSDRAMTAETERPAAAAPASTPRAPAAPAHAQKSVAATPHPKPAPQVAAATTAAVPSQAAVDSCNQIAAQTTQDKTIEVVKDAAIGAVVGAAVGAAGGAIADGGKGAGKGAAIGGIVGAGGGSLYGVNKNKQNDERYREAYASCMRSRGYAS